MTAIDFGLEGKRALVVGAGGGGMGTVTALALADAGAAIAAVDRSAEQLDGLVAAVESRGVRGLPIVADARDSEAMARAVAEAAAGLGGVEVLVNVVGGSQTGDWHHLERYPDDVFTQVIDFNLGCMLRASRAAAALMLAAGGGRIVNFASVSGLGAAPYHGPYGAAKAGVIALTRTMAVEWAPDIRVNAVAPGRVRTPRSEGMHRDLDLATAGAAAPPVDVRPEDVAATVLFLASDLAAGISGQTIAVDGGVTAASAFGPREFFAPRLGD